MAAEPGQPTGEFGGQRVVVAGGTSGVGLATAIAYALAGCTDLVLVGRDELRGKQAVETVMECAPAARVEFVSADLNTAEGALAAAASAHRTLGGIDVLVCSTVAPYQPTLLHDIAIEQLRDVLVEQALGPLLMTRAVLPFMREAGAGAIVTIASDAAKVPTPGETGIGAAMAAIVTFSQTLAVEAKRDGIRVNVLTPSLIVNTASYDRAMAQEFSKRIFDKIVRQAALGLTEPEDLAEAALFLTSPRSRRITGQVLSVNGGISVA
ncbi:SDR family NAD(P)-dependent oxidoreductase [Nocardioides nitrophenolicus]|uniref:SDR family NAD(P)-dependent oxidoreductase n=1 Tax=Nocardioides nitrophenolicus TaxID=60489 RepID=UPI0019590DBA|nr:SDR family oxidoreductase [Nocardioides nitrophenolicus]MBM7517954.1 NAD(P)-dependent dehydrogenase (short-subunit alcohol dehydrogenase family) [Nocardioides nitrophenolicus]